MNKRICKKRLKKLISEIRNARKNHMCITIKTQTPVYKDGDVVAVQTHNPIIKRMKFNCNANNTHVQE